MTKSEVLEVLTDIFRDVFDDDTFQVTERLSADDMADWNSLQHINLIMAIESEFGVRFRPAEIQHLTKVGNLVTSLTSKVA